MRNYSPQICGLHIDALRSGALGAVGGRNSWVTAEIYGPISIRSVNLTSLKGLGREQLFKAWITGGKRFLPYNFDAISRIATAPRRAERRT